MESDQVIPIATPVSFLLALPKEIQEMIYGLIFGNWTLALLFRSDGRKLHLHSNFVDMYCLGLRPLDPDILSLMLTCRSVKSFCDEMFGSQLFIYSPGRPIQLTLMWPHAHLYHRIKILHVVFGESVRLPANFSSLLPSLEQLDCLVTLAGHDPITFDIPLQPIRPFMITLLQGNTMRQRVEQELRLFLSCFKVHDERGNRLQNRVPEGMKVEFKLRWESDWMGADLRHGAAVTWNGVTVEKVHEAVWIDYTLFRYSRVRAGQLTHASNVFTRAHDGLDISTVPDDFFWMVGDIV